MTEPTPEDSPNSAQAQGGADTDDQSETDRLAQTKAAFAAALERKKAAAHDRQSHLDGHGGVEGSTASHKATRTFRRKSG